jgi:hypothetical protein
MICSLTRCCAGDKIEKIEIGRACSAYGWKEAYTGFWWGNLKKGTAW